MLKAYLQGPTARELIKAVRSPGRSHDVSDVNTEEDAGSPQPVAADKDPGTAADVACSSTDPSTSHIQPVVNNATKTSASLERTLAEMSCHHLAPWSTPVCFCMP